MATTSPLLARRAAELRSQPRTAAASLARRLARRRWYVAAGLLTTVVVALLTALLGDDRYSADATVVLRTTLIDDVSYERGGSLDDSSRRVANEIAYLEGDLVRAQVTLRLGSETVPRARGIASGGADTIVVRAEATTPQLAQLVASTYASAYVQARSAQLVRLAAEASTRVESWIAEVAAQLDALGAGDDAERAGLVAEREQLMQLLERLRLAEALETSPAEVVSDATSAVSVTSPRILEILIGAIAAGLAIGLIGAVVVDLLDDVVRTGEDLERAHERMRVLARLPVDPAAEQVPVLRKSKDPSSVAYRMLRNALVTSDPKHQVILVAPHEAGDGGTTVAANLTIALAEHGARVVLVDADLRSPRVHEVFGVDGSLGLVEVLAGDELDLALLPLDERVSVLTAGTVPPDIDSLVIGTALERAILLLRHRFDHVVLDTPPISDSDDAFLIASLADLVAVVTRSGSTSARRLRRSLDRAETMNITIDGCVLNRAHLGRRAVRRRADGPRA